MIDLYASIELRDGRSRRPCTTADGSTSDAIAIALYFVESGVAGLHLVDMDARAGKPSRSRVVIATIVAESAVPVQVSSGAVTRKETEAMLDTEAERVVLAPGALDEPGLVEWLGIKYPERVLLALDPTAGGSVDAARRLGESGIGLVTVDYSGEGDMTSLVEIVAATSCGVMAVMADDAAADVEELAGLEVGGNRHLDALIVGGPLYAGPGRIAGALEICN